MKLEELLDIERFTASLTHPHSGIFRTWSSTAFEICPDRHRSIAQLRDIYLEIPSDELRPRQVISFIESLLAAMSSDDDRRTLIRTEALQFRTFERP